MRLSIHGHHVDVTDALDDLVTERFRAALGQHLDDLMEVIVRLEDVNGPKGGRDKRCQATIHLRMGGTLVAEDTRETLEAAIDSTADVAKRIVGKKLEKIKNK